MIVIIVCYYPTETLSDSNSAGNRKFPFLDAARCEQQGTRHIAEVTLDPMAEPFLMEHRLEDRPLLPVVIGMEMLAEAAAIRQARNEW